MSFPVTTPEQPGPITSADPYPSPERGYLRVFDFEKIRVYQESEKLLDGVLMIINKIPRGHRQLADQLSRASTSICLNVAEGAGEFQPREKARFYRMALRSATESASVIRILNRYGLIENSQYETSYCQLTEITKMLTKLASKFSNQEKDKERTRL